MLYPQQLSLLAEQPGVKWEQRGLAGEQLVSQCLPINIAFQLKKSLIENLFTMQADDELPTYIHEVISVVKSRRSRALNNYRVCIDTTFFKHPEDSLFQEAI